MDLVVSSVVPFHITNSWNYLKTIYKLLLLTMCSRIIVIDNSIREV